MIIIDKVKYFLSDIHDISLGYNEVKFILPENLDDEQVGYRIDTDGNSLVTGNLGDWKKEWIVIASDQLGDPIIVDVSSPELKVLSAAHGEGDWEPIVIASSLDNFKNIISILNKTSTGRTNPVDLENNPISKKEGQRALTKIQAQNPDAEISYWEFFFEND